MRYPRERRELLEAARRLHAAGLTAGTSGNASLRVPGGLLVTPTGIPYDEMTALDMVDMRADGSVLPHQRAPSSEWRIHRDIYAARPEAGAVLHFHSLHATALACLRKDIPAFHYMVAVAGGSSIRCARYATYGSQALSESALAALEGRRACLLANHGAIVHAEGPRAAHKLAVEVENLAAQYVVALKIGEPALLDEAEMERVLEAFRGYGQPSRR